VTTRNVVVRLARLERTLPIQRDTAALASLMTRGGTRATQRTVVLTNELLAEGLLADRSVRILDRSG
jgi:hypothetical protein